MAALLHDTAMQKNWRQSEDVIVKDAKSFEISSLQPLAADTADSLHLKEIDYFHSFASCDHQENSFQNQDVAGNFVNVIKSSSPQFILSVYICISSASKAEVRAWPEET